MTTDQSARSPRPARRFRSRRGTGVTSLVLGIVIALTGLTLAGSASGVTAPPIAGYVPPIKHVFVINIENKGYDSTFGPTSAAPYLAKTLRAQGVLLKDRKSVV